MVPIRNIYITEVPTVHIFCLMLFI